MSNDPVTRLNAALEGRYRIEREVGQVWICSHDPARTGFFLGEKR